jgi:probable HAF family extracellular repeat protein
MKITRSSKIQSLILAAALSTGLGFVSPVSAQVIHSYILESNGEGLTDLGTLAGGDTYANGINDAGQVAGTAYTAAGARHAFITGPNGVGMTDLGTLGGDLSIANGINDAGQVVGWSRTAAGAARAFITGPNGVGMTDLNSLVESPAGIILTRAVDINNVGQAVATGVVPEPQSYALMLAGLILVGFMARRKRLLA